MTTDRIEVIVIGTEPPCPRCDLLNRHVRNVIDGIDAQISHVHLPFDSPEAQDLGRKFGRKIGTAKQVAEAADVHMNWQAVYEIIEQQKTILGEACAPADLWSPELDLALDPCQQVAESAGYLMTPILIVKGEVKHHGSVPSLDDVRSWVLGHERVIP